MLLPWGERGWGSCLLTSPQMDGEILRGERRFICEGRSAPSIPTTKGIASRYCFQAAWSPPSSVSLREPVGRASWVPAGWLQRTHGQTGPLSRGPRRPQPWVRRRPQQRSSWEPWSPLLCISSYQILPGPRHPSAWPLGAQLGGRVGPGLQCGERLGDSGS